MSHIQQDFSTIENTIGQFINGRIDLLSEIPTFNILNSQKKKIDNTEFQREATLGQLARSPLSDLFFSSQNIEALQQGIRYRIYTETSGKYVIGRQSDQELRIIMRSVYYQYARNDGTDCVAQTRELNAIVLDWAVPEILSNLLQYQVYKKDASTLPIPLDNAQNMSRKGTKSLELKSLI